MQRGATRPQRRGRVTQILAPVVGGGAGRRISFWPPARVRRPADAVRLAVAAAALLVLVLLAVRVPGVPAPGVALPDADLDGLPRTLLSVASGVASLGGQAALGAVLLVVLRIRRLPAVCAVPAC